MSNKERKKRERGGALVETALTFTVFIFMLIGAADFGQFLFIHQALVERARGAARWGALNSAGDLTAIQNMVLYNQSTVPSGSPSGYFGLTSTNVQVTNPGSGTDSRILILITNYPYKMYSPTIAGTYTGPNITVSYPVSP